MKSLSHDRGANISQLAQKHFDEMEQLKRMHADEIQRLHSEHGVELKKATEGVVVSEQPVRM
jgi:hypothetical protein